MKKNKKNEDSTLEPDIPYDGDTNVKKKQSLSDKVTIMKNQVRDFLLDHPKTKLCVLKCMDTFIIADFGLHIRLWILSIYKPVESPVYVYFRKSGFVGAA